jgi:8-oxo-dGTP pyrophosphatase MutT (NUDIX family)
LSRRRGEHVAADKLFYVGQKAFIERDGALLVLFSRGRLDLPGGRVAQGEYDLADALKREVREETALEIDVGMPFVTWFFEPPERSPFLIGYRCSYVSGEVAISTEHDGLRWVTAVTYQELGDGSSTFDAIERYYNHCRRA